MNVHFDGLRVEEMAFISPEIDAQMRGSRVFDDDVLLNITGASIGRCCVLGKLTGHANVNQHVCAIRLWPKTVLPEFLAAFLSSEPVQWLIKADENGTSREGLNFAQIGEFPVPVPPPDEQSQLVDHIGAARAQLGRLEDAVSAALARLLELRTSLIAAAVTGQIDVREAA